MYFKIVSDMKRLSVAFILLIACVIAFPATTADVAIRKLREAYSSVFSFSGSITIKIGSKTYSGTIKYKVPNKLKISFYSPSVIDMISDGTSIWIYIKGNNTVIKQPILSKKGGKLIYASEVINPYEKYDNEYIIVLDKYDDKTFSFTLKAKPDVFTTFSTAKLIAYKSGLISSISGITITRESLSIEIKYTGVNINIDDREFFFTPPADAQVLADIFQE